MCFVKYSIQQFLTFLNLSSYPNINFTLYCYKNNLNYFKDTYYLQKKINIIHVIFTDI